MNLFDRIERAIKEPFRNDGDIIDFALLAALGVTIAFAWSRVLKSITE